MIIQLCQIRPTLGHISHNVSVAIQYIEQSDAEMIIFPELYLTGYPPTDAMNQPDTVKHIQTALTQLTRVSQTTSALIIIGGPFFDGTFWRNAAWAIADGACLHRHDKCCLPNHDIFNESRYFSPGHSVVPFSWKHRRLAMLICEDIWVDVTPHRYTIDPVMSLHHAHLDALIHISASPYDDQKPTQRITQLTRAATVTASPVISINQVGAYTDILFDGRSTVVNPQGAITHQLPAFAPHCEPITVPSPPLPPTPHHRIANQHAAILFGLTEYVTHHTMPHVIVGLSGGIDSAVVAALAVQALGAHRVWLVSMPTQYNSAATQQDAQTMAEQMGCRFVVHPIDDLRHDVSQHITQSLGIESLDEIPRQNIQSRLRGLILMTIANQTHGLLLTTGNKSELAMGYTTLYGDMCGGFNIIGDLFKTDVMALAHYIHDTTGWIPPTILSRPPSAELAPNQQDTDTLPDYHTLDAILAAIMITQSPPHALYSTYDPALVDDVYRRLHRHEFKRHQSPPILKLSPQSFGRGWQYPITI